MCGKIHSNDSKQRMSEKASLRMGEKNSNFKHGETNTSLYGHWKWMKTRCIRDYKGKGRSVCNEWENFANFRDWAMSNGFNQSLSLDRIDNSKGYYPENCQWIPMDVNRIKDRRKHNVTQEA